jgi:hypothetical protein
MRRSREGFARVCPARNLGHGSRAQEGALNKLETSLKPAMHSGGAPAACAC